MTGTTKPLSGAVVSVLLILAGLYLALGGTGVMVSLGLLFLAVGALGVIANLLIRRTTRR
jgi:hypothetical protein